MATVNLNLIDASVATVDSGSVSSIYATDGKVFVNQPSSPFLLESSDNLATTVALFSNFVAINTPKGVMYLAKERFDLLDSNFDPLLGLSFTITITGTTDVTDVTVNSVSIIGSTVSGANAAAIAEALSNEINGFASTPEYTASFAGAVVTVFLDPEAGSSLSGTVPVVSNGGDNTKTNLLEGSKFHYDLDESGVEIERLCTDDIVTLVALLGNIVTVSGANGDFYLNKNNIKLITVIDASSCRVAYATDFGVSDIIYTATESRASLKAKIDAL
jgi:hypothetical protein|tara:strand:+ start:1262 stop:2083 length:822 start_codon:yes stop_codon:yes gene_type:complete